MSKRIVRGKKLSGIFESTAGMHLTKSRATSHLRLRKLSDDVSRVSIQPKKSRELQLKAPIETLYCPLCLPPMLLPPMLLKPPMPHKQQSTTEQNTSNIQSTAIARQGQRNSTGAPIPPKKPKYKLTIASRTTRHVKKNTILPFDRRL